MKHLHPSTQRSYDNTIRQLYDFFGGRFPIKSVERRHAEAFISTRKRCDGRTGQLSPWSIAQHIKHCRALFGAAVDWQFLGRNPFVPPNRRGRTPLRCNPRSGPWHHLVPAEFKQLIDATPNVRRRAMYWMMYGAGLRPGETYNLTVDRIDIRQRRIRIANRRPTPEIPPFVVKADEQSADGKERFAPIPTAAVADLVSAMREAFKSGGFISLTPERFRRVQENWRKCHRGEPWGNHKSWKPWENRDMVNNALRDAKSDLRRACVSPTAPFTLTAFRKSFAQNHADAGTHPRTLAKLLGHSDVRLTLQFYQRVTDANERSAAANADRLFDAHFHGTSTKVASDGPI